MSRLSLVPVQQEAPADTALNTEKLVLDHMWFVEMLARQIATKLSHSIELDDLMQAGVVGMISVARKYDDSRGVSFANYARRRVHGAMIDSLRKNSWPRGLRKTRRLLRETRALLCEQNGVEPSIAQLARHLKRSEKNVIKWQAKISLAETTSPNTRDAKVSSLPAGLAPTPQRGVHEECELRERAMILRRSFAQLPLRDRQVLKQYYYQDLTMKQMGENLGVNESRVSQIHSRALRRLRDIYTAATN